MTKKKNTLSTQLYYPSDQLNDLIDEIDDSLAVIKETALSTKDFKDGFVTRPATTKLIWAYIHQEGLQDKNNKRIIKPDAILAKIIGNKKIDMLKMAKHVGKHLEKAE